MSKIALKSDSMASFGGIFYVMDQFERIGLPELINRRLGGVVFSAVISIAKLFPASSGSTIAVVTFG